ncbi:MAG TPA: hypothetical protein VHB47_13425 [Thermoanaerobaculia bacterium]|jgi:hypothetical protein|nr:hypothetical protein [Thermoanaerobaculia bacterium]
MSAERRKVLEMLAAGKITPEEADQLLDRLASPAAAAGAAEGEAAGAAGGGGGAGGGRPRAPRFLRVVVDSPERDTINIRLPLGLIRTGLKISTLMPRRVSHRLSERGIDLSHLGKLDDEALIAELAALQVDIAAEDGEKVRIFCE